MRLQFPVMIPLGPWTVHPHWLFESLGHFLGFRAYLLARRRIWAPWRPWAPTSGFFRSYWPSR
ncbi:MAG TPA: hypothetical protein VNT01_09485 [Symbiobacteriaceae bacterium]|nr:hypothetical protein [Symbiobacteriaceae bacterium]